MELSVNQRIKEYVELRGISQEKFRIDVGAKEKGQVSKWFACREGLPASYLAEIIVKYTDLNVHWLVTGQGSMLNEKEKALENEAHEPILPYKNCASCDEKEARINELKDHIESLKKMLDSQLNIGVKKDISHCA